jgi:hypothetical protein
MTRDAVRLTLDAPTARYLPGERLTGRFFMDGSQVFGVRSAELSVLWYTS